MKDYNEFVTKYSDSFTRVAIDKEYMAKIESFAKDLAKAKSTEIHHINDHGQDVKRFVTGLMGEAALEKILGINVIDWTIGKSGGYNHPDIPGYKVGVKSVEKGKYPIIFKNNYYPQIICIRSDKYPNLMFVCGLATTDMLNQYQDDDLIVSPNLRARGTKTGFWGFNQLKSVKSLSDLTPYKK